MHLFTCWIEHRSVSPPAELMVVLTARNVFKCLDICAWHVKQMFAAEVMRLETESRDKSVKHFVSGVLHECPEMRQL